MIEEQFIVLVFTDRCTVDDCKTIFEIGYVVQFVTFDDWKKITMKNATSNMFDVF